MSRLAFVFPDLLGLFFRAPHYAPDAEDSPPRLPRAPGWGDRRRARTPRL